MRPVCIWEKSESRGRESDRSSSGISPVSRRNRSEGGRSWGGGGVGLGVGLGALRVGVGMLVWAETMWEAGGGSGGMEMRERELLEGRERIWVEEVEREMRRGREDLRPRGLRLLAVLCSESPSFSYLVMRAVPVERAAVLSGASLPTSTRLVSLFRRQKRRPLKLAQEDLAVLVECCVVGSSLRPVDFPPHPLLTSVLRPPFFSSVSEFFRRFPQHISPSALSFHLYFYALPS